MCFINKKMLQHQTILGAKLYDLITLTLDAFALAWTAGISQISPYFGIRWKAFRRWDKILHGHKCNLSLADLIKGWRPLWQPLHNVFKFDG